jgi:hypothetical protein
MKIRIAKTDKDAWYHNKEGFTTEADLIESGTHYRTRGIGAYIAVGDAEVIL